MAAPRLLRHEPHLAAALHCGWAGAAVRPVDPAGLAYQLYARLKLGLDAPSAAAPAAAAADEEGEADELAAEGRRAHKKRAFRATADHYELLGLGAVRYGATDEQIKAAYKRLVLVHHPDKEGGSDEAFKAVQAAYEVLSDPRRRRVYDSQDEVDESLPDPADTGDFFVLYRPAFERLARFSVRRPVPSLGDERSPADEVAAFYAFWFVFDSWREFSHQDEYDPEQAESRDEKRWMERQNEKRRAKLKREELERVARLVEQAHRKDPRVAAAKAAEREARLAEKRARKEAAEREREAAEGEARRAKEEKEAAERAERERREAERRKQQAQAQAARARVRALALPLVTSGRPLGDGSLLPFTTDTLDLILSHSPVARLLVLSKDLEAAPSSAKPLLAEAALVQQELAAREAQEVQERARKSRDLEAPGREWSAEEVSLLVKALAKYPAGHTRRWEMVAGFIGTNRSAKEIIAKTNQLKAATATASSSSVGTKGKGKGSGLEAAPSQNWDMLHAQAEQIPAATAPAEAPKAESSEWSVEQQRALEDGLRRFPASLGPSRWDGIAKVVPGRSKKECIDRFKFIAERLKAAKK